MQLDSAPVSLRWLVLNPSMRGLGEVRQLMKQALDFVDSRFTRTYLWTFSRLDAARHLYGSGGFTLTEEREGQ
jgi:predicted GNAT family N-acyltransferase